jgi:hypothetical protein
MHGRLRLLALAAVGLAVATVAALVVSWLQRASVAGVPIAIQETAPTATAPAEPTVTETTTSEETPTERTPTSTTSSTQSAAGTVTIAKRKTVTAAPSCPTLITGSQVAELTGTTASPEPDDKGFCGFDLAHGGSPAGVAMVVLTPSTEAQGAETTSFEGNTAYRTTTALTTCDLRVALTDDQSAPFRALWVTLVLNTATQSTCPTVDQLAKLVFDKLPNG